MQVARTCAHACACACACVSARLVLLTAASEPPGLVTQIGCVRSWRHRVAGSRHCGCRLASLGCRHAPLWLQARITRLQACATMVARLASLGCRRAPLWLQARITRVAGVRALSLQRGWLFRSSSEKLPHLPTWGCRRARLVLQACVNRAAGPCTWTWGCRRARVWLQACAAMGG